MLTTRYRRFGEIATEHGVVYIIEGLDGVCTYGKGCIQQADFNGCCCMSPAGKPHVLDVMSSPGSRIWLRGGAVLLEGRHIDNECMRSQGRIQKAGGGGGGVLSVLGPIQTRGGGGGGAVRFRPDSKAGGGGGGAACRSMIYILVCARVRDSAWGMERGGGAAIGPRGRHFV